METRICTKCKQEYPIDHFKKKGSGRNTRCAKCVADYFREYYHNNPERKAAHIARIQKNTDRQMAVNRAIMNAAKSVPCADCGEKYPSYVMDFDHLSGKLYNVAAMLKHPRQKLLDEIAKCEVVCSNCHRERTHSRLGV